MSASNHYYDDILKKMDGSSIQYVPTTSINPDGCYLEEVDSEFAYDAFQQMNSVWGDLDNGEITCGSSCEKVDINKDGIYFDIDGGCAIAVLGGKIISALYNDREQLRIEDHEFNTDDL